MEDLNMLAADCVVICCCCQCMILQILVFALLKLPSKLIKKTRDFAKRKLNRRRRRHRSEIESYIEEIVRINSEECCFRVEEAERERGFVEEDTGDCMEEVERAIMEFYRKGEFAFGSFWGREAIVTKDRNDTDDEDEEDDDGDFVRYRLIEMFGSLGHT